MGLNRAFGKECVATQSRTMPPDEVAYGVASDGDLTEVAYDVAQPTKKSQTVHLMPVTSGHVSVTVKTILKGFEDFLLLVPMLEWSFEKLSDALVVSLHGHMLRFDSLPW